MIELSLVGGLTAVLFGVGLWGGSWVWPLWVVTTLVWGVLLGPGNLGVTTGMDTPATYGGSPTGGPLLGDLTFFLVVTAALAGAVTLQGRPHGVEQFLLAGITVGAGWATLHTDHLVVLYLNLELQALALYTLVGYHRYHPTNMDAALRYLLAGSLVSGFTLYGFVLVYLGGGSFTLGEHTHPVGTPWVAAAVLFKLGAFPFWFWTPPVYEPLDWGTLALVVGPAKVNLWWLLAEGLAPVIPGDTLWAAAVGSILVGAVGGYFQVTATGVLAYSGVVNAGYLLVLARGGTHFGVGYYLGVYLVGTAMVILVASPLVSTGVAHLNGWVALGGATPLLLYYGVLNLGGLPVWPGFFGKVVLVEWAVTLGWGFAVLVVAASILPAVYYVGLATAALFEGGRPGRVGRWTPVVGGALWWGLTAGAVSVWSFFVT